MENAVRNLDNSEPGRFRSININGESREALMAEIIRLRAYVKELELAADADALAPVYNRRAFLRELVKAQSVHQRYGIPTSLILFDLDGFKRINDRYGPVMGDELLVQVGQVLQTNIRDCDLVARLGSDDFAVLLFKCEVEQAREKAAELVTALEKVGIDMPSSSLFVEVSFGLTRVASGMTPERIMSNAGEKLAQNKRIKQRSVA